MDDSDAQSTSEKLFKVLQESPQSSGSKITVVGVGSVGMACAFSILAQTVSSHLCLIDTNEEKLCGELLDLQHGSGLMRNAKIEASSDYALSAGSKICVVTAGARQNVGESRLKLLQRNADIMKTMIPQLVKYSPDTVLLMVSNPVDVLTYIAWRLSGFPSSRVLGSGTNLDSTRFRLLISQKLGVAPSSVHGNIIGEHGDSSVPVWSNVNVAGVRLNELNPLLATEEDPENWADIHKQVVQSAYDIIAAKGYTSWAIGLCVSDICRAILRNTHRICSVSTHVHGLHGITEDVYLSLPAVISCAGVSSVVMQQYSPKENELLKRSAKVLAEVQRDLTY